MAPYDIVPDSESRMSTSSCPGCCGGWVLGTPDVRVRPLASYGYRNADFLSRLILGLFHLGGNY